LRLVGATVHRAQGGPVVVGLLLRYLRQDVRHRVSAASGHQQRVIGPLA
jgi:hypothetical protein